MTQRLSSQQKSARLNFVINRIRDSLTRSQITNLVTTEFGVSRRTACTIYKEAIEDTIERDPSEQRYNRAVMLEQLYHQASAAQTDISALQSLIDRASRDSSFRLSVIANMIGEKSRVRSQLVKTFSDIARIYGLYTDMPLLQAISVLANSEMLPPEVAGQMLMAIEDMTAMIEKSMKPGKFPAASADQN
jgi:hypothetical protein